MGKLIIQRKETGKSIGEYADGVLDMYNTFVTMLNNGEIPVQKKGK